MSLEMLYTCAKTSLCVKLHAEPQVALTCANLSAPGAPTVVSRGNPVERRIPYA